MQILRGESCSMCLDLSVLEKLPKSLEIKFDVDVIQVLPRCTRQEFSAQGRVWHCRMMVETEKKLGRCIAMTGK